MSVTINGAAEASSSSSAVKKGKKMVDGREETKEERRARKEAKRAQTNLPGGKAAGLTPISNAPVPSTPTPQSNTADQAAAGPSDIVAADKKGKKDKKRKRTEDANASVDASSTADDAPVGQPGTEKEDAAATAAAAADPKEEKRARKAARKAEKAAAATSAQPASGPSGPTAEAGPDGEAIAAETGPSEAARKALQYVQSYITSHLSSGTAAPGQAWKFNKANQNWLIRNVWNESEVPEERVDDVMAYLNTIKGGGRQALITMAEKCRTAPESEATNPAPPAETPAAATSTETPATTDSKPAAPAAAAAPIPAVSAEEAQRDREVIRARAEKLLALLRA